MPQAGLGDFPHRVEVSGDEETGFHVTVFDGRTGRPLLMGGVFATREAALAWADGSDYVAPWEVTQDG